MNSELDKEINEWITISDDYVTAGGTFRNKSFQLLYIAKLLLFCFTTKKKKVVMIVRSNSFGKLMSGDRALVEEFHHKSFRLLYTTNYLQSV